MDKPIRLLAAKTVSGPSYGINNIKEELLTNESKISAQEMQVMVKHFFDEMDQNKFSKKQFQEKLNTMLNNEESVYNQTQQDKIYELDQKAIRAKKDKLRRDKDKKEKEM